LITAGKKKKKKRTSRQGQKPGLNTKGKSLKTKFFEGNSVSPGSNRRKTKRIMLTNEKEGTGEQIYIYKKIIYTEVELVS